MGASNGEQATLWREIEELLARARETRPLHHADALLDVTRRAANCGELSLITRLAEALEGWDGQLLLAVPDNALAPLVRHGDRAVVDAEIDPSEGDIVALFVCGDLLLRNLTWRDGRQWLMAAGCAPIALGPEVAILGVVVELRRALVGQGIQR